VLSVGEAATKRRRRRRSPQEASAEIIAAAEALLRERPFRELTVDEVMRRTDLSRPSFYVYFRDRHHLVLRVVEHITAELLTPSRRWLHATDDGPAMVREALTGVVDIFAQHGSVLRALADAATDDPDVEQAYGSFVQTFVDAVTRHVEDEVGAGRMPPLDAGEVSRALILMNERYLSEALGREPHAPHEVVVETLATIWTRTLYPG